MIRYPNVTPERIAKAVDLAVPTWVARAGERTSKMLAAKRYIEESSIWSEIKLTFMRLQYFKCIFCERQMAQEEAGAVEQDVEHFRPKSSVKDWKPRYPAAGRFPARTGGAWEVGYYWLAYDLQNYAASCKPCNSARKSNYFPIAAGRGNAGDSVAQLNRDERPFLVFPYAEDPQDLITFRGVLAVPRGRRGHGYERALVTIDLLDLNERGELIDDRFRTIREIMHAADIARNGSGPRRAEAVETLLGLIADDAPQAGCARAFMKLMDEDTEIAWAIYLEAKAHVRARKARR